MFIVVFSLAVRYSFNLSVDVEFSFNFSHEVEYFFILSFSSSFITMTISSSFEPSLSLADEDSNEAFNNAFASSKEA